MLKRIKRPVPNIPAGPIGEACPMCQVATRQVMVSCPDGRPGCCVIHAAWQCPTCLAEYIQVSSSEEAGCP